MKNKLLLSLLCATAMSASVYATAAQENLARVKVGLEETIRKLDANEVSLNDVKNTLDRIKQNNDKASHYISNEVIPAIQAAEDELAGIKAGALDTAPQGRLSRANSFSDRSDHEKGAVGLLANDKPEAPLSPAAPIEENTVDIIIKSLIDKDGSQIKFNKDSGILTFSSNSKGAYKEFRNNVDFTHNPKNSTITYKNGDVLDLKTGETKYANATREHAVKIQKVFKGNKARREVLELKKKQHEIAQFEKEEVTSRLAASRLAALKETALKETKPTTSEETNSPQAEPLKVLTLEQMPNVSKVAVLENILQDDIPPEKFNNSTGGGGEKVATKPAQDAHVAVQPESTKPESTKRESTKSKSTKHEEEELKQATYDSAVSAANARIANINHAGRKNTAKSALDAILSESITLEEKTAKILALG